jgi:uroporphyrinogen decarboxylase
MVYPWPETVQRWRTEGLSDETLRDADPGKFIDDRDRWVWESQWFFPFPPFQREVVEETERTVLYVNHEGILMRERKDQPMSSMPQFVRFPVENREDFRAFARERLQPNFEERLGEEGLAKLAGYRDRDFPLIVIADRWGGFFGALRNLTGVERLCMLFYDDPAFVEEMMDTVADFLIEMVKKLLTYTDIDVFGFWEDMAYKNGPLIAPEFVGKYMVPRYRRVVDVLRQNGVEWISLDSDGNVTDLLPHWLDAGINVVYPFEPQAGMDVVAVRKRFGRDLRLWGGVDKRALAVGKDAMDAELRRVRPLIEEGGYVAYPDHGLPPDVPFENYRYFMQALRKTVGME